MAQIYGVSNSGFHFLIGYVISLGDTKEFAEKSHLQCLYLSFNVCCYGPHFTCIKNMDMARECISLIMELMVMFLLFQMTFSLVTAAVIWLSWRVRQARIPHPIL